MDRNNKYTCPRCGFDFFVNSKTSQSNHYLHCQVCNKEMNIYNGFKIYSDDSGTKKAHYLHKSLLN